MAKVFRVLSTLLLSACSVNVTPSASPAPSLLPSPLPTTGPASTTTMPEPGTVEGVRADLQTLVTTMERSHVRLFDYVPAAQWQAAVSRLDELVPSLVPGQPERLMVEFMRLVALPGVVGGRHGHIQAWP
ncbi:MAG TPA: hypothetical protein VLA56_18490, partial [Pseudomonadales bacterium]|nr:hypothetical protein [Pseudomonadales bacterium]